ncbi:MAG: glycosyltransferase 87 family protein [Anaerolineales bacterium]
MSLSLPAPLTFHLSRFTIRRWTAMLALGGLSVALYWGGLLVCYNLFAIGPRPLADIAKLTRNQPLGQAGFVLTFAALSGVYYLAWRLARGPQPRAMWVAVCTSLLAMNVMLLWLYPIGAADVFDNIVRGRITAQHGGNPFYQTPREFKGQDPFYAYAAWRDATSAYGPLWEVMAAGTSQMVGDKVVDNVIAFKLLSLLFYAGCTGLIARLLQRHAPDRALQGTLLFAWNPLVIYETAGNGHNDIVMVFFILLALYALSQRRFTLSTLALMGGALVKFIPILLAPIVVVVGLRAMKSRWQRIAFVVTTASACALLVVAAYAPFWRGGDPLGLARRSTLFTTSLPALAQVHLEVLLGPEPSQHIVAELALLLTGAAVLVQAWRVWSNPQWAVMVRAFTFVLLFYLLFTCLWFQAWYAVWPLALAALLPEGKLSRLVVLLSYAALWKTIFFDFVLYRGGPLPPRVWRETWLGVLTLGLSWAYAAISNLKSKI